MNRSVTDLWLHWNLESVGIFSNTFRGFPTITFCPYPTKMIQVFFHIITIHLTLFGTSRQVCSVSILFIVIFSITFFIPQRNKRIVLEMTSTVKNIVG